MPQTSHGFMLEKLFDAPVSQVYQLLSNEEYINLYLENSTFEPFEKGNFVLSNGTVTGEVLELQVNKKIRVTYRHAKWPVTVPSSEVCIEFQTVGAGTKVLLHHYNLPNEEEAARQKRGWELNIFKPLEAFLKL